LGKPLDKLPIIVADAKKAFEFYECFGCGPIDDGMNLLLMNLYPLSSNNVS
jgi:hypothetical protein